MTALHETLPTDPPTAGACAPGRCGCGPAAAVDEPTGAGRRRGLTTLVLGILCVAGCAAGPLALAGLAAASGAVAGAVLGPWSLAVAVAAAGVAASVTARRRGRRTG